jgi:hypothetical protein
MQREQEEKANRPLPQTEKENRAEWTTKMITKKRKLEAKKTVDDVDSGKQPTLFAFYNSNRRKTLAEAKFLSISRPIK